MEYFVLAFQQGFKERLFKTTDIGLAVVSEVHTSVLFLMSVL